MKGEDCVIVEKRVELVEKLRTSPGRFHIGYYRLARQHREVAELPDREGRLKPAVSSEELIGKSVDFAGKRILVAENNLADIAGP